MAYTQRIPLSRAEHARRAPGEATLRRLRRIELECGTREEADDVADAIAGLLPDPVQGRFGLIELLLDATEPVRGAPAGSRVVDGDPVLRGIVQRYLRSYDIDCAECVGEAIARLAARTYDLLLLDRQLPDGLGDHVIDEVHRRGYRLPI